MALPEFDQPAFVIIRKSNRFAMHDHMEAGRNLIIKTAVAHFPLPAVDIGAEDILMPVIGKAGILKFLLQQGRQAVFLF